MLEIKIGNYVIVADEREYVVKNRKTKAVNGVDQEYFQPLGYFSSFAAAVKFIPEKTIRRCNDITEILTALKEIQNDIKALPDPIKVEIEKEVFKTAPGNVTIPKSEYDELVERNNLLTKLEEEGEK